MEPKTLMFGLWIKANKSLPTLLSLLEGIASNASSVYQANGKILISASVAGQNFSYTLPNGWSIAGVLNATFEAWKIAKTFETDEQLDSYFTQEMPRNTLVAF